VDRALLQSLRASSPGARASKQWSLALKEPSLDSSRPSRASSPPSPRSSCFSRLSASQSFISRRAAVASRPPNVASMESLWASQRPRPPPDDPLHPRGRASHATKAGLRCAVSDDHEPSSPPSAPGPTRDEVDQALSKQPWATLSSELTLYAYRRIGKKTDAEDLAQTAIGQAYDPTHKAWNFRKERLWRYLVNVVDSKIANAWRRVERKLIVGSTDDERGPPVARYAHAGLTAEELLIQREEEKAWEARIAAVAAVMELRKDELALQVLACFRDGIDTPREQAERLGKLLGDITNARRRLADAGSAVLAAESAKEKS
jgi:DNA-directed RNA polymerase specialized sigma24 family protein